jgi:hypothetical protein
MTLIEEHRARPAAESGWLVCLVVCLSCSCDGTGSSDGGSDADADGDGDTDTDADMDSDTDSDSDTDTETETETQPWTCEGEDVWEDPETGLCWTTKDVDDWGLSWESALAACSNLGLNGYQDWCLPKIQHLVALLRGCPSADCQVTDPDCLTSACNDTPECEGCEWAAGPGSYGAYWPVEMGECLGNYWSQSPLDGYESAAWYLSFGDAQALVHNKNVNKHHVRCVRADE